MSAVATKKEQPVLVRMPKAVVRQLDSAARQNGRSRNSEIVHRLSGSFRQETQEQLGK